MRRLTAIDELHGTFAVTEYAVDSDPDDEVTRITGTSMTRSCVASKRTGTTATRAPGPSPRVGPSAPATAAWSGSLTVVDVDQVTVWDRPLVTVTPCRCALISRSLGGTRWRALLRSR